MAAAQELCHMGTLHLLGILKFPFKFKMLFHLF